MLSIAIPEQQAQAALAAGLLACPGCSGPLSPWGYARLREVRMEAGVRQLTPARARCRCCKVTHVLAPAWLVPRRRDSAQVIGQALWLAACGYGHRRIARHLDRPASTVRGWLRTARTSAEDLRGCATRWSVSLDCEHGAVIPAACGLGDALEAIMLAVRAWVLRFGQDTLGPWERAVWLTGGLLYGCSPLPP